MSDIIKKPMSGLLANISSSIEMLARSSHATPNVGGVPLLRMMRDGEWVLGQMNEPIGSDIALIVNTTSFLHGWQAWTKYPEGTGQKNELVGEVKAAALFEAMPSKPDPVNGQWPFNEMRGFECRSLVDDEVPEALYKANSIGGTREVKALQDKVVKQVKLVSEEYICPVITLSCDSYINKTYGGKTYNPVFNVIGWANMDGDVMPPPDRTAAIAEAQAPAAPVEETNRRRPAGR